MIYSNGIYIPIFFWMKISERKNVHSFVKEYIYKTLYTTNGCSYPYDCNIDFVIFFYTLD